MKIVPVSPFPVSASPVPPYPVLLLSSLLLIALTVSACGGGSSTPPPPVVITVSVPIARATLATTQTLSLSATTNDSAGVTWTANSGSFSPSTSLSGVAVTYTAPSSGGNFTITAASATTSTTTASIAVAVSDLAGVTTYHNDLSRDGANTQEYALTPTTVNTATFGKLFSCPVDGAVYSQPLWMPNLTVSGARHNVVFVATAHDSLYAFDADNTTCQQLWHDNLIDTTHGAVAGEVTVPSGPINNLVGNGYGDITPEVGVTGTPVIDPTSGTLYVVSKSVDGTATNFYQRLHAIDITTGNEKFSGPAAIGPSITYPGTGDGNTTVAFSPHQQHQRAGLALVNGIVYVAWASHEDTTPYYGWVAGFKASDLSLASVVNITPNVGYGGIWMGGGAPAADSSNNLYLITGNGGFDATSATAPNNDYGDSFLQLSSSLAVTSYFTPSDEATDQTNDADFGSGGSAVVLNLPSGSPKHLVIGGGKDGMLYLLDGDTMGGLGDSSARQHFYAGNPIFATGAFWNNNFYIAPIYAAVVQFTFDPSTNLMNPNPASNGTVNYYFPGATPSVSANGVTNGVVWALDSHTYCTQQSQGCGPAVLHAYNATNVTTDIWNSAMVTADAAGYAVKFTVPTVANGHVYVGTRGNNIGGASGSTSTAGELDVYGIKPK
jgi:hypothetical protein